MNLKSLVFGVFLVVFGAEFAYGQGAATAGNPGVGNPLNFPGSRTPRLGCDYSNAWRYNGWGWDAGRKVTCAPACDYKDAWKNNGWGWNSSTRSSCPPR